LVSIRGRCVHSLFEVSQLDVDLEVLEEPGVVHKERAAVGLRELVSLLLSHRGHGSPAENVSHASI
jgi:hypothetical protein